MALPLPEGSFLKYVGRDFAKCAILQVAEVCDEMLAAYLEEPLPNLQVVSDIHIMCDHVDVLKTKASPHGTMSFMMVLLAFADPKSGRSRCKLLGAFRQGRQARETSK